MSRMIVSSSSIGICSTNLVSLGSSKEKRRKKIGYSSIDWWIVSISLCFLKEKRFNFDPRAIVRVTISGLVA